MRCNITPYKPEYGEIRLKFEEAFQATFQRLPSEAQQAIDRNCNGCMFLFIREMRSHPMSPRFWTLASCSEDGKGVFFERDVIAWMSRRHLMAVMAHELGHAYRIAIKLSALPQESFSKTRREEKEVRRLVKKWGPFSNTKKAIHRVCAKWKRAAL